MDPFALIMMGIVGGLIVWVLILGRFHPRSGAQVLDWRPTRSPEMEAQNEVDDLEQMLDATNERRRRRGLSDLTEDVLEERVREDQRESNQRRERYLADEGLADQDVRQMLAATNVRRRRRGEPELTEAEFRARVEADQAQLGDA